MGVGFAKGEKSLVSQYSAIVFQASQLVGYFLEIGEDEDTFKIRVREAGANHGQTTKAYNAVKTFCDNNI